MKNIKTLKTKINRILDKKIDFAYLFGSTATASEGKNSDIDIAVFPKKKFTLSDTIKLENKIEDILNKRGQVILLNKKIPLRFIKNIINQGIILKDSDSRKSWGKEMAKNIKTNDLKKLKISALFDSLEEKAYLIRKHLKSLKKIHINKLFQGDEKELEKFIGKIVLNFAPVESAVLKLAHYLRKKGSFRQVLPIVAKKLNLTKSAIEIIDYLAGLRNLLLHAYWQIPGTIDEFNHEKIINALNEFSANLGNFIIDEKIRLDSQRKSVTVHLTAKSQRKT